MLKVEVEVLFMTAKTWLRISSSGSTSHSSTPVVAVLLLPFVDTLSLRNFKESAFVCFCVFVFVYLYLCFFVFIFVCLYLCVFVCVFVFLCVCV